MLGSRPVPFRQDTARGPRRRPGEGRQRRCRMRAGVRRILAMAVRVLDFIRAHPSTEASYVAVVSRLVERLKRADTLAVQERDGLLEERNATARRLELRRTMLHDQLRHLAKVADMATRERSWSCSMV